MDCGNASNLKGAERPANKAAAADKLWMKHETGHSHTQPGYWILHTSAPNHAPRPGSWTRRVSPGISLAAHWLPCAQWPVPSVQQGQGCCSYIFGQDPRRYKLITVVFAKLNFWSSIRNAAYCNIMRVDGGTVKKINGVTDLSKCTESWTMTTIAQSHNCKFERTGPKQSDGACNFANLLELPH